MAAQEITVLMKQKSVLTQRKSDRTLKKADRAQKKVALVKKKADRAETQCPLKSKIMPMIFNFDAHKISLFSYFFVTLSKFYNGKSRF